MTSARYKDLDVGIDAFKQVLRGYVEQAFADSCGNPAALVSWRDQLEQEALQMAQRLGISKEVIKRGGGVS